MKKIYTNIDDVVDKLGKGIDENVKGAVWHLNRLGVQTISSCEGHQNQEHFSHFWIDFYEKDYDKALNIIYDFNKTNFNVCINRLAYYDHIHEKMMCCRLMPIQREDNYKSYEKNKELLKDFEKYLKDYNHE
jgi:hypothetical protein